MGDPIGSPTIYLKQLQKHHKSSQKQQKTEVIGSKHQNVILGFAGVAIYILPVGDQTGKGCDECANTTDVDTQQKFAIVFCKLGQKNCGRYIADELAGKNADKQCAFL